MSELPNETPTNPSLSSVTSREQGGSSVTEQNFPHSGGRNVPEELREQPVREFDKTSMEEAIEMGYLGVPTSPSVIPEAQPAISEVKPTPEKKKRKGLIIGLSAGAAGAVIAASAIIGINASNSTETEDAPEADPKATTEVAPDPETVPEPEKELSLEQQIDALKIEAGQTPEVYAKTLFEDRIGNWGLAGTETLWEQYLEADGETQRGGVLQEKIADEQKNIYANALFQPGWQDNLSVLADQYREINEISLTDWLRAHVEIEIGGSEAPEWQQGMVVEQVELLEESPEAGTRKLFIAGYETNNGAETANKTSLNTKYNGAPWSFYVTTVVVDGTEYISGWSVNG